MTGSSHRFDLLRIRYAQSLPLKREALKSAWDAFVANPGSDARAELQVLVHRLAGSAPAYGFDALGARARAIDGELGDRADHPANADPLARRLAAPFRALLDELAEAAQDASIRAAAAAADEVLRLIIVEDDPGQAAMIGAQLEARGCIVRIESGSDSLRQALMIWPCHAVVLDFWLRGETAAEIAASLRSDASLAPVALICFSIESDPRVLRAAIDAGCDATVAKHEGPDRLYETLRECVLRRAGG